MISKLQILNFQSHKDSSLQFDPGVNVIVGSSDSGKTAIIRALRWLIWNRPSGDSFRSSWGGPTAVTTLLDKETVITRGKTDSSNEYKIDTQTFTAFGNDIPEPIQKAINIDETNLQQQLDAPFLISKSPGEVASYFNRIAHLDQIDVALKTIQGQVRQLSSEITSDEKRVTSLEKEFKGYVYLDQFEIDLEELEKDQAYLTQLYNNMNQIMQVIETITATDNEIERLKHFLELDKEVNLLCQMWESKIHLENTLEELHHDIIFLSKLDRMITYQQVQQKLTTPVNNLLKMYESKHKCKEDYDDLTSKWTELAKIHSKIIQAKKYLDTLNHKLDSLDVCPFCGSIINKQKIKKNGNKS
ncbi:MAG: AAA family ATPase [Ignavibacteriales bacterium]|nr:AAA family ATPase [Ignavibacteriales bacterium]